MRYPANGSKSLAARLPCRSQAALQRAALVRGRPEACAGAGAGGWRAQQQRERAWFTLCRECGLHGQLQRVLALPHEQRRCSGLWVQQPSRAAPAAAGAPSVRQPPGRWNQGILWFCVTSFSVDAAAHVGTEASSASSRIAS